MMIWQPTEAEAIAAWNTRPALAAKDADRAALTAERDRLREKLASVYRHAWCWPSGDERTYDYPLEWAEYELEPKTSPCVVEFGWAGPLPNTWAIFTWAGAPDDGEWNAVEHETEEAARAVLASLPGGGDQ